MSNLEMERPHKLDTAAVEAKVTRTSPKNFVRNLVFGFLVFCIAIFGSLANAHADQIYKGEEKTEDGFVPDFTQYLDVKNRGICYAAAIANSLWFWDQHGYKDLVKQKDESKPNANWEEESKELTLELAKLVYGKEYVNTEPKKCTTVKIKGKGYVKGVQEYLDKHKTKNKEPPLVIQWIYGKRATYERWEKELKDCEDVVAAITWRDDKGNKLRHKEGSPAYGHALTGVGYDTEKKKFKISHGWGYDKEQKKPYHSGEKKPYPDDPHKSVKDSKGRNYYQEYSMEITEDGRIKIPKDKNPNADLFSGKFANAAYVIVEGFFRISPGKKGAVKDSRQHTPNPKIDQYIYSVENLDFNPIYQFALEVQVPFFSVEAPAGWAWTPWDPTLTIDVTPAPTFSNPPEVEPFGVIWEPEWRGILWYTFSNPILSGYELNGFSFKVDSKCGHSEMAALAGFSDGVTTYITGESSGLITEFATASGPTPPVELPTITSINPDHGNQGETLDVIITGTNFDGATEVIFGAGITVNSFNVDSSTQITADITIDQMCAHRPTTIFVTTSAGTATLEDGFTVQLQKGCFIATAAYGTPMAQEIEILREFRDEYLLTNPLGQALVNFYYRVSPPIAEFISEHPSLKPIVRAGLLPAVAMSVVAVNTSPAEKMAIIGLLVLVPVVVAVWATRRRSRGPEYT